MTVRTLIVDDSAFFRRSLIALLAADDQIEIVGEAGDGVVAIELARKLRPDVITMDVEMPIMDGISAVRRIHAETDSRILMFSHLTTAGAQATLDALSAGAADFMPKRLQDISERREDAVRAVCNRIRVLGLGKAPLSRRPEPLAPARQISSQGSFRLVVIGASTGGPVAVQTVLAALPEADAIGCPLLVVQHMPANFTRAFAERLDRVSRVRVKEAENGDVLEAGMTYVAPGGRQLRVVRSGQGMRLVVEAGDPTLIYKPSVDVTFGSVAEACGAQALAIVLTGMGSDGCAGSSLMKAKGARIWAESEASCVVYGMPQAVVNAGLADQVASAYELGVQLARAVTHTVSV